MNQATHELRTLLERFANGKSLGMIGDAMQTLYNDAQQDEELRNWFRAIDTYTRKVCTSSSKTVGTVLKRLIVGPARPRLRP